jgi:hypothetical protein
MDRTLLTTELAELELARQQIADLESRIDRQRALLCELDESDRPGERAVTALEHMEDALEGYQHHAHLIEQEIAQATKPAASDRAPAEPA